MWFKVILGSFCALFSEWPVTQTRRVVDRLKRGNFFKLWDTINTYMGQYSLHLLHFLSNQGYFDFHMSKLGLGYIAIAATWLLGINLTCSNLASDQAERQGP